MRRKPTVAGLLSRQGIETLALRSNLSYGTAMYRRGAVQMISDKPHKVEAWVGGLRGSVAEGGGSRRRAQLMTRTDKLTWHCSGNPKDHQIFCKHCVALALAVLNRKGD